MDYPDLNGDQFKRLVNLLKLVFGIVSGGVIVLTGVAMFLTFNSVKELKEDLRMETEIARQDFEKFISFSKESIIQLNSFSEKQIKYITDDAVFQANQSAQNEVESMFANNTEVKKIVSITAEKVFGYLESEVNEFTEGLPDIFVAIERIGNSRRDGLERIIRLNESPNRYVSEISNQVFLLKKNDFYRVYNNIDGSLWGNDGIKTFLNKMKNDPGGYLAFHEMRGGPSANLHQTAEANIWRDPDRNILIERLIKNIESHGNLDVIAMSTFFLIEMTDIRCELFDFDGFETASNSFTIKSEYLEQP